MAEKTIFELGELIIASFLFVGLAGGVIYVQSSTNLELKLLKSEVEVLLEVSENENFNIELELKDGILVEYEDEHLVYSKDEEVLNKKTKYTGDSKISQETNVLVISS